MMKPNRRLVVVYGSQTGTAQDVAERVVREAKRRYFNIKMLSLDEFPMNDWLTEKLVVIVCSTTGQGDPPDNMQKFWKFIMRRNLPASLTELEYGVIGLGDSSYQKYNVIGKKLHKRLQQLGATPIMPVALGDDQHDLGPDAAIDPWLQQFWSIVLEHHPIPDGLQIISNDIKPPSRYTVQYIPSDSTPDAEADPCVNDEYVQYVQLISNNRVTADDHFQDVRHVKFDISNTTLSYEPGDVMMIYPKNSQESIKSFMELLKLDPDSRFILSQNDTDYQLPHRIPNPCTVHYLVESYLDINSVPRRYFFELLSFFADSEIEKEKFRELASAEGQQELFDYCNRPKRTTLEVLEDFPGAAENLTLDYVFDLIPPLQPRAFSIASSLKAHAREIQLLVAVVKYKTKLFKPRTGVCSTWLSQLEPLKSVVKIPASISKGKIYFPTDPNIPVIMVGPGTGLAPFRSFIHDRVSQGHGNLVLFFGCRNRLKDDYCCDEWIQPINGGRLKVFTAYSRDQDDKIYVQHLIKEQGDLVWELLHQKQAWFFIAGNANQMPDNVKDAVKSVVMKKGSMSEIEADNYIINLEKYKRFQVEAWS